MWRGVSFPNPRESFDRTTPSTNIFQEETITASSAHVDESLPTSGFDAEATDAIIEKQNQLQQTAAQLFHKAEQVRWVMVFLQFHAPMQGCRTRESWLTLVVGRPIVAFLGLGVTDTV